MQLVSGVEAVKFFFETVVTSLSQADADHDDNIDPSSDVSSKCYVECFSDVFSRFFLASISPLGLLVFCLSNGFLSGCLLCCCFESLKDERLSLFGTEENVPLDLLWLKSQKPYSRRKPEV